MRRLYRKLGVVICSVVLLSGCSRDKVAGNIEVDWEKDERSYTAIVKDDGGTERVRLECQYVGKAPEEPVGTEISRNWSTDDTDFYHFTLVNLTDKPIELKQVSFRLKKGKEGKVYEIKNQKTIELDWGSAVIAPNGDLSRRNAWTWGKGKENVLHKIYLATSDGQTFQIDTQLVYRR